MIDKKSLTRPAGAVRVRTWLEEHGYNVEVVDYLSDWKWQELELLCKKLITKETLFVGVSITFFTDISKINLIFNIIKKQYPHVKTIIGGPESIMLSMVPSHLVDRVIFGYSEQAILHYLDFLSNKRTDDIPYVVKNNLKITSAEDHYKNDTSNLTIKWKHSDLIENNFLPIEISRGCVFKCKFCAYPLLGKHKSDYIRCEENLIDEFKENFDTFSITNYSFQDDTFNDNIFKLEMIANAIAKSNVKITYSCYLRADLLSAFPDTIDMLSETGCIGANFGFESFNTKARNTIGKGGNLEKQFEAITLLKSKRDVFTWTGMIVGLPYESEESIMKSHEWLISQNRTVFNRWNFFALGIRPNPIIRLSEFEKDYSKYGYRIDSTKTGKNDFWAYWENDYMNQEQAVKLANLVNSLAKDNRQKSGFLGSGWDTYLTDAFAATALVGAGVDIKKIVNDTFTDEDIVKILKKEEENVKKYKRYKLSL